MKLIKNTPFFKNNGKTFLFLHIPKSGGTAYRQTFLSKSQVDGHNNHGHLNLQQINERWPYEYKNSFKYTIKRNDYDRFISWFNRAVKGHRSKQYEEIFKKYNFKKHIDAFRFFRDYEWLNKDARSFIHVRPNDFFLNDKIDFIIEYDNFQKDINRLHKKINLPQKKSQK